MNITIIGGAGTVASLIIPYLSVDHTVRVYDLKPPPDRTLAHTVGTVNDYPLMLQALQGADSVIYMAMGTINWSELQGIDTGFDANVKGLYLALRAAREANVGHAIYTSSMSVYDGDLMSRYFYNEDLQPDGRNLYALTKYFGELVCRNACVEFGMSVNALRMCFPVSDAHWQELVAAGQFTLHTAASDLARAMNAALRHRNAFQVYTISGEYEGKVLNMDKARRELGWEPNARPNS